MTEEIIDRIYRTIWLILKTDLQKPHKYFLQISVSPREQKRFEKMKNWNYRVL
jgi:hypothetical protein